MKAVNDSKPLGASSQANPRVYSLIERFTKQAINAGFRHYSMMSIVQRSRHTQVETDDGTFKLNNHAPYCASLHAAEPAA